MKRLVLIVVVGCSGSNPPPPTPVSKEPPPRVTTSVAGYWTGDWGQLVLRDAGAGKVIGAYVHDQGTISGTITNDRLVGWWCEVPSRKPDKDAGEVELRFLADPDGGNRRIDGRWRYGTTGDSASTTRPHSARSDHGSIRHVFASRCMFTNQPAISMS